MDHAYRKKRASWAVLLNGAALERKMTQEDIRELVTRAIVAPPMVFDDGTEKTWVQVLDVDNPASKLAEKIPRIRGNLERAVQAARRDKVRSLHVYAPGPGAPNRYYDGDEEITCDEWRRRGGRFAEEVDEARRAARL